MLQLRCSFVRESSHLEGSFCLDCGSVCEVVDRSSVNESILYRVFQIQFWKIWESCRGEKKNETKINI